jgi:branched-chain amino acid transport system ATP-binding protein
VDAAVSPALVAESISAGYGKGPVLFDVSVHAAPGEVVAVLGHNGAGKSSLLRALFGLIPLQSGSITFDGVDISSVDTSRRVRLGMAYSPQQDFVFRNLSVRDNLRLARFGAPRGDDQAERVDKVLTLFPILGERLNQRAGTLSGGQQRMLSIGIALLTKPTLIMLDEPSLGIAPKLLHEVMEALRVLVERSHIGLVLAEQNVREAAALADRAYVLRRGSVIHESTGAELLAREEIWELF